MPKQVRIPSYRFHRGSGQAVVVLGGKSVYLGKWNTPESRAEYARVIAEWLARGQCFPAARSASAGTNGGAGPDALRVSELILAFWEHAKKHYRHPDGSPTGEQDNLRDALRPLRKLYGHTPAKDFGPKAMRALREEMVRAGLCRKTINARVNRVRRVFRWAASVELIPVSIVQALATVEALRNGRCDARESKGVTPVNWEEVEATLPHLPRPVAAMVQIMRFSNCRAEDAVILRGCDLRREGDVWEYRPAGHKNAWREESSPVHKRVVCLGPRCQEIIRPFLPADPATYLFSPKAAREEYQARRAQLRKTKRTPSELRRRRKLKPRRAPRDRYTVNTFQQSVRKTCQRIGVAVWSVLQVRHTRATEVRERYGLEGAAAALGDTVEAAQIYAEKNRQLARRIAREIG
jgi:integrase